MKNPIYKKGDKFETPSGIIEIKSISKETRLVGSGYRIGRVIVDFTEFENNVITGIWKKIN